MAQNLDSEMVVARSWRKKKMEGELLLMDTTFQLGR
jgi:hypothetical protein